MRRVLVVGSGIAGLSAAYHLARFGGDSLQVALVESAAECGGHSLTLEVDGQPVDLGFQVFNRETYPTLVALYNELGLRYVPSEMSFATETATSGAVKYSADPLPYLRWLWRAPREVFAFVREKRRFHAHAAEALAAPGKFPATLGEFFQGYEASFYHGWIVPFAAAVWSLDAASVADFELQTFLRFMANHGFLSWSTFDWLCLEGGARAEVDAFLQFFARTGRVTVLRQTRALSWDVQAHTLRALDEAHGVELSLSADCLVLACHAPQARAVLGAAAPPELASCRTSHSQVYLHSDRRLMPRDRSAWCSWNVSAAGVPTYWLACIQKTRVSDQELFVSLLPAEAPAPAGVRWAGSMQHPQLQHGTAPLQRALLHGGPHVARSVFFAGAWLQYGFHEDGAMTGAVAARHCLAHLGLEERAQRVPVLRVANRLQHMARPVWVSHAASVAHASAQAERHSFAHRLEEQCVVDLSALPHHWWGGVLSSDHWGGEAGDELQHVVPRLVDARLGFWPTGCISLVTTARAFGQVMNPISVFVCWSDDQAVPRPVALVLEVHNFPWGERHAYVLDARPGQLRGTSFELTAEFPKVLHVSPWHPHPALQPQRYRAKLSMELARDERPFEAFCLQLDLLLAAGAEPAFSSTWSVAELQLRPLRPIPIGLQTAYRILREALPISASRRVLYSNVINPHAPVSMQTCGLAMAVALLCAALLERWAPAWSVRALLLGLVVWLRQPEVPLLRDAWLGLVLALVALALR